MLKEGENYKFPLISMKGYVAFKNENNDLFVVKINFKNNEESFKVSDKVASYAWDDEGNLLFSKYTGGLYLLMLIINQLMILKQKRNIIYN